MCFSYWPPSLFVRMWLWGPAWCSFMFVPPVYPSSHLLRGKEGCQICVSSLRFGSGLYVEAGFLGGKHLGVCGSGSCRCTLLVVPISVCGVFSVAAELCILSSCWGWGRLLLCLFWCDCSAFSWGHLRFSAPCHAAGYPSGVPHLADSGWLTSSCGGGLVWVGGVLVQMSCYPTWVSTLCQRSSPFRCFPFGVLRPCRERQHV